MRYSWSKRLLYLYGYEPVCFQGFVVAVTMLRELYDDLKRFVRDREVNGQRYYKLTVKGNSTFPPHISRYFIPVLATLQLCDNVQNCCKLQNI